MKNIMHLAGAGLLAAACAAPAAWAGGCATNAAPRAVDYPWMTIERWKQMNAGQVTRAEQGNIDVMFVGDSLTEMRTNYDTFLALPRKLPLTQ